MTIPHWENTDKWGVLRDIVNEVIDVNNALLDSSSLADIDVVKGNTDVYNSFTDPGINWDNVSKNVYARRNGKTVELMVYIRADWVSPNSSSFPFSIDLKDIYKGKEDSLVIGTLLLSKQNFGAGVLFGINPNGYVEFDSSGNLSISLEDGLMSSTDSSVMQLNITYMAKNNISDFIL